MLFFFTKKLETQTNVCYNKNIRKGIKMKGRVKWWSNESGYGFIEYDNNDNIFVHVEKKDEYIIKENQEIEFIIEEKETGRFLKLLKPFES